MAGSRLCHTAHLAVYLGEGRRVANIAWEDDVGEIVPVLLGHDTRNAVYRLPHDSRHADIKAMGQYVMARYPALAP